MPATAVGVGCWLAALNVRFRDVQVAVPVLVQLWLFCTPVAYPSSIVPESWRPGVRGQPDGDGGRRLRRAARRSLTCSRTPSCSVAVALALAVTGVGFFWRTEDTFADIV